MELNVDHADWGDFSSIDVTLSNAPATAPPQIIERQDWHDTFVILLGTEYMWLKPEWLPHWDIAIRTGYVRSETPVPDRTFNPAIPDADSNAFSVGLGFLCHEHGFFLGLFQCGGVGEGHLRPSVALDLAYQAVLYEDRTVRDNINPTVDGTYQTTLHSGALSLRLNF